MPIQSTQPQDTLAVIAIVVVVTTLVSAAHWRAALRVLLALTVALAVLGGIVILYSLFTVMAAHHG